MAGFDKEIFVDLGEIVSEEYECGICLGIVNNPNVVKCCGKVYCKRCISNVHTGVCPNCRSNLKYEQVLARCIANVIDRQLVYCLYKGSGCNETYPLRSTSHLKVCRFNPFNKCQYCNQLECGINGSDCLAKYKHFYSKYKEENVKYTEEINQLKSYNEQILISFDYKIQEINELKVSKDELIEANKKSVRDKDKQINSLVDKLENQKRELLRRNLKYNDLKQRYDRLKKEELIYYK